MKIRLPAFLRDQIADALTAKFRKDVELGKLRAICTYEKGDSRIHTYLVEFQETKNGRTVLLCHGESHDADRSEDIPLRPEQGDIGISGQLTEKLASSVSLAEGDELVIILHHEVPNDGPDRFKVQFKPPYSTVVYLELTGESSGEGRFPLLVTGRDSL